MNRLLIKLLKFIVRRIARYHRFIDPVDLLARLAQFGQPSEVAVPTELLRAGARMHARGLLNSQAIQYNLDWIWPYWVVRQFDPSDTAFVPRAFSLTHINLTHRNWTCVGDPAGTELPIVDPRGLVTPFYDSWSLDFWIVTPGGSDLILSEATNVQQSYRTEGVPIVETEKRDQGRVLKNRVAVVSDPDRSNRPTCRVKVRAKSPKPAQLVVSLRPYNPEGVSTVDRLTASPGSDGWVIEADGSRSEVHFDSQPNRTSLSNFESGDVYNQFPEPDAGEAINCDLGMITAAASYTLEPGESQSLEVRIPLDDGNDKRSSTPVKDHWDQLGEDRCDLRIPNSRYEFLFRSSVKTLQLLSGETIYPGPFTYRRFWFRDAAFMLNALLVIGHTDRAREALDYFPEEQTSNGYFCSQKGEWDSNGEALWIMGRYCDYTDSAPPDDWVQPIRRGAQWILSKRTDPAGTQRHAGLLPAGFSAEHFGPNDYYYWDDFWSVAGLRQAASMLEDCGDTSAAAEYRRQASDLLDAINHSMEPTLNEGTTRAMPPSPYRNVDAGSIGSIAAGYPHNIYPPGDDRLLDTVQVLMDEYFHEGTFFQEMIHSGRNPYLSLHLAQVLLKASDERFHDIVESVAAVASPTGKWPEAVHPATNGGCMGDGEHGWAAAEWVLMIRNMFVRGAGDKLVVGQGIPSGWLDKSDKLRFGPTRTTYGKLTVEFTPQGNSVTVTLNASWHGNPPVVKLALSGFESRELQPDSSESQVRLPEVSA